MEDAVARIECPFCDQPIEYPASQPKQEIHCPGCQRLFTPEVTDPSSKTGPASLPKDKETLPREQRAAVIHRRANQLTFVAMICFGIGLLLMLIGVARDISSLGDSGIPFGNLMATGSCWSIGFWLSILAQIMHIRANTEK